MIERIPRPRTPETQNELRWPDEFDGPGAPIGTAFRDEEGNLLPPGTASTGTYRDTLPAQLGAFVVLG